jgi:hypothetical protein
MCVCVCKRERERERESVCVCVCMYVCIYVYIYVCMYVCIFLRRNSGIRPHERLVLPKPNRAELDLYTHIHTCIYLYTHIFYYTGPHEQLVLPKHNRAELDQGIYRTGQPDSVLRNYAWRGLAQASSSPTRNEPPARRQLQAGPLEAVDFTQPRVSKPTQLCEAVVHSVCRHTEFKGCGVPCGLAQRQRRVRSTTSGGSASRCEVAPCGLAQKQLIAHFPRRLIAHLLSSCSWSCARWTSHS